MIVSVNLLPWRNKRRQQAKKLFMISLLISALASICIVFSAWWFFSMQVDNQTKRNKYLSDQIDVFNKKIEQIAVIKTLKADLTERIQMIEGLQNERSVVVYIFDILNDIIPDGVYLTDMSKRENSLQIIGVTDSNSQISKLMRSINNEKETAWFRGSVLHEIKNVQNKSSDRLNEFRLTLTLDPSEASNDMPSQMNSGVKK
ncbi:PilN domain-containing protein [Francisellaceae bacterium]|nr:PilN domain-containing protein [Francisellaceae bacterium]